MASKGDDYQPQQTFTYVMRPLTKGISQDGPYNEVPKGAFTDVLNALVTRRGLERSPGTQYYCGGNQVALADRPLLDIVPFWEQDGTQIACLITSRFLYTISGYAAATEYGGQDGWEYTTGTADCSATEDVTGAGGSLWDTEASQIRAAGGSNQVSHAKVGDWIAFNHDSYATWYEIASITDDTHLKLVDTGEAYPDTVGAKAYKIRRTFHIDSKLRFDTAVGLVGTAPSYEQVLFMTDYERPPVKFDGSSALAVTNFVDEGASAVDYICGCLTYFKDRLWIANLIENRLTSAEYHRQRIRWSNPGVSETFESTSYIDLPYSTGSIRRMEALGSLLVVYFEDAIYIGRPSADPLLPYNFFKIDTGGVGLAGVHALTEALGGHIFLGKDDVYFLDNTGIKPMNCPQELLNQAEKKEGCYITVDPERNRFVVGVADATSITSLWSYNFKTNVWSRSDVGHAGLSCISNPLLDLGLTWADLATPLLSANTWTALSVFNTWDAMVAPTHARSLFAGDPDGYITQYVNNSNHVGDQSIQMKLITGMLDFKRPELDKTFLETRLRLLNAIEEDLLIRIFWSNEGGITPSLTYLGASTISAGSLETKLNFKVTASAPIFLFWFFTDNVDSFTVTEITFKVRGRGIEIDLD